MKKTFSILLIIIQQFSFFIGAILAIIFYNSFNISFYETFYKNSNLASLIGTTYDNLLSNTKNLLAYLKGEEQLNAQWFSTKDIQHMVDVKNLYDVSNMIMICSFIIFLVATIIIIILLKKETIFYITKTFNKVLLVFILVVGGISASVAMNFNAFWIKFHTLLFTNDLWLLSLSESNLIKMVPEEFFTALVVKIIIHVFILFFILSIVNIFIKKKLLQRKDN